MVIKDEDIAYAERILFGREAVFDDERKTFIKNLELSDLQAVPGSGKTTALLAKLLILANHQPFTDGSGILVISHTNTAIDQIREKIGIHCPNLFRFPNFIGTVQSFINTFLANPFYEMKFGFRPDFVDAEYYNTVVERRLSQYNFPAGFTNDEKKRALYFLASNEGLVGRYRFDFENVKDLVITNGLNGKVLTYKKPSRGRNYLDFTDNEKAKIKEWLCKFKIKTWKEARAIHYDDAYFLAKHYLLSCPQVKAILRKRFTHVFVDEMQDMEVHQVDLIDRIFIDEHHPKHILQRIGDKNQAIFSYEVRVDDIWKDRTSVLTINGSLRLSAKIATKVTPLALSPNQVNGNNVKATEKDIPPRIIVYNDDCIQNVISQFHEIIKHYTAQECFPNDQRNIFKAIGWRRFSDEERKTVIKSYHLQFGGTVQNNSIENQCFEDYLLGIDKEKFNAKDFNSRIINAVLCILDKEELKDGNLKFTPTRLKKRVQELDDHYEIYKTHLFEINKSYLNGNISELKQKFKDLSESILNILAFPKTLSVESEEFISSNSTYQLEPGLVGNSNIYLKDGIEIEVATVHSVKGETHTGTLYLESFYQSEFESTRLMQQLKGIQFSDGRVYHKQSTKMMYVGFSRPTHLLCLATHIDRINGHEIELESNGWVVDKSLLQ